MKHVLALLSAALFMLMLTQCTKQQGPAFPADLQPPVAQQIPVELTMHGHTRIDPFFWMNDRDNPAVIDYLNAENDYLSAMMAHTEVFQESLFSEMRARIKEDDSSVPYLLNGYYYYTRYEEGNEYPIYARKKGSLEAAEEIILDVNVLAEGKPYTSVGSVSVSDDGRLMAFAVDHVGRRIYTIRFRDLETGAFLDDEIPNVTGNLSWAADNETVFYSRQDPQTLRSYQIFRHRLGSNPQQNPLVFQEDDDTYGVYVMRSKSQEFVMLLSYSSVATEYRFIPSETPEAVPQVIQPRERHHEYFADHFGDHFYFRTNYEAQNFRLMRAPVTSLGLENWEEVIAHRPEVLLEDFDIFSRYLVLSEVENGLPRIRIREWESGEEHYMAFDEPAYLAYTTTNLEFDTELLRYGYTSLTTPNSVYEYNMASREHTLLKEQEVLGNFNRANYVTERHFATAADGTQIPVSLVYRKGTRKNGKNPLLQYGYGSYGYSMTPTFSSARLSLLDRGFVFAIAHVRGGEEMGREWYEQGKLENKMNSFTDFIAVSEYLIEEGFTNPNQLYAMGGSAGGLLMGAVMNLRPDLYNGIVAQVPFVDVVTTMLDDSIPLTTGEYDEWGNPNDPHFYEIMLAYSPYDQVSAQAYPHLLVTSGLHDSQVQYWEPTKWVARLRELNTSENVILLYTNMDAGHGGASGRFQRLREVAMEYAFLLELEGIRR
ncbi:MAG: S9 family peptidase [Balneolales bacterium]|nr:S9 family peptidase [Balneolales bacterium]